VTLLYPFAPRDALDDDLRGSLARILSGIDAFAYRLTHRGQWPDTLFASVEPELPFRSLYEDVAAAFPSFPIYQGRFAFVPHVTIAEGPTAGALEIINDPAWETLPAELVADSADLLVHDADGWNVRWQFGFGSPTGG